MTREYAAQAETEESSTGTEGDAIVRTKDIRISLRRIRPHWAGNELVFSRPAVEREARSDDVLGRRVLVVS